jgi:hypothetical protein
MQNPLKNCLYQLIFHKTSQKNRKIITIHLIYQFDLYYHSSLYGQIIDNY